MKNEENAVKALISITVLPSLLSVLLYFVGVKSYISLIAYCIGSFFVFLIKAGKLKINLSIWFLIAYLAFFISSYYYTVSRIVSIEKTQNIIYNVFIPITIILLLFKKQLDFNKVEHIYEKAIGRCSVYISIILAFLLFAGFTEPSEDLDGRDTIIGLRDAIWCSRYVGFLLLPIIIEFVRYRKISIIQTIGSICALYIMIKSGSRGPLFSLLITVIVLELPQMKLRYKVITLLLVLIIYQAFSAFSSRMTSESTYYSNMERLELLNTLWESKFDPLIGVGIGGFAKTVRGEDIYLYPHNIFAETYIEIGAIGVFLLSLLLLRLYKCKKNSIFFLYCFYFFVNALVSGDIASNNYFFVFGTILLCMEHSKNTISQKILNCR